jgi:ATP-dependent exoDNAse (exonuclease V) alpha subunit
VSIFALKDVDLHAGDRIRWTDNDHGRELLNAQLARVEKVGAEGITVSSLSDGTVHELARDDRMLDLAYALNVHIAQGVTDHGIVMMSAQHKPLASQSSFLIAVTRIAGKATLVVDSGRDLERAVQRNPGKKAAVLEVNAPVALPKKYLSLEL